MTTIHAAKALTPAGWQGNVRLTVVGGTIATAEIDAALGSKHLEEQKLNDLHLLIDGLQIEPRVRGFSMPPR